MRKFLSILILFFLTLSSFALAQVYIENPLRADSFEAIIDNIIDFIFTIAIVAAPLMIVWAAFLFVTSGGNAEQVNQAKRIIIYTLIGLAIILLARGLIAMIKEILGV